MATPDKVATVKALADQFRSAQAVYVTEYRGLSVAQLKQLRKGLSGTATYAVVKNTLAARAAKDAGLEGLEALFVGPTAVAFVTGDPVEAAKGLRDFSKESDKLVLKGGILEGNLLSAADLFTLASLESREVLLAMAAGAFKASLFGAAYLLQAPLSQAVRTVDALREKQDSAA